MPSSEEIGSDRFGSGVQKPRKNKFKGKRAARACEACRRLKTRCIISPVPSEFYCLRCESLGIRCSFQDMVDPGSGSGGNSNDSGKGEVLMNDQINQPAGRLGTDAKAVKLLIKHGYGTQDAEITSKLLHSINNNVLKVLNILKSNDTHEIRGQGELLSNNIKAHLPNSEDLTMPLEAVKMLSSVSAPVPRNTAYSNETDEEQQAPFLSSSLFVTEQRHTLPYLACPFTLFAQLVSKDNLPISMRKLYDHDFQSYQSESIDDIISLNLISQQEAICLISDFRERYGAWCSLSPSIDTEELLTEMRTKGGSLLIVTMCVLALRYTDSQHDLKTRVYKNLLFKLKTDLEYSLKILPQSTEFLQAIVILSLYASSFSSDILSIDAWYISGIGLQQYITANVHDALLAGSRMISDNPMEAADTHKDPIESPFFFGLKYPNYKQQNSANDRKYESKSFMSFRLWNHLCLVHVTHSIYSGRMCVIDEVRFDLSRRILELPNATNFDGRMVGEISLHLILYNFMQKCNLISNSSSDSLEALENAKEELNEWLEEWSYLFTQPITQFLEFAYHYGYTMILYIWHHRYYRLRHENLSRGRNNKSNSTSAEQNDYDKIMLGNYLNDMFPIESIIQAMSVDIRIDFLNHSHKALKNLITTEFSVFQYLSDQLIFAGVLCSLLCIAVLHNLDSMKNDGDKRDEVLLDVKTLSMRLQQVRNGELKSFWVEEVDLKIPSVILQYHKAIENYLLEKFPPRDSGAMQ